MQPSTCMGARRPDRFSGDLRSFEGRHPNRRAGGASPDGALRQRREARPGRRPNASGEIKQTLPSASIRTCAGRSASTATSTSTICAAPSRTRSGTPSASTIPAVTRLMLIYRYAETSRELRDGRRQGRGRRFTAPRAPSTLAAAARVNQGPGTRSEEPRTAEASAVSGACALTSPEGPGASTLRIGSPQEAARKNGPFVNERDHFVAQRNLGFALSVTTPVAPQL